MKRGVALVLAVLAAGSAAQTAPQTERGPHALFAGHDCCGRLAHSEITRIGDIRSGGRTFTLYSLWFVNPQSLHGMKHLAVVEGRRFRGAYILSSSAMPVMKDGVIRFTCENGAACEGDVFTIRDGKLPPRLWVDGEVNPLGQTI